MNNASDPGLTVDGAQLARELAAQLSDNPKPMGNTPPGYDPHRGSRYDLTSFVRDVILGDEELRGILPTAFSVYVGDLMYFRGMARDDAILVASQAVEDAVAEARRELEAKQRP